MNLDILEVESFIGAEFVHERYRIRGTSRRHFRSPRFHELNGKAANAPGSGENQNTFFPDVDVVCELKI